MDSLLVKLSLKNQVTVPKAVRKVLHLHPKDQIFYEIFEDGRVMIRKAEPLDMAYLNALTSTVNKWDSDEDEKAYNTYDAYDVVVVPFPFIESIHLKNVQPWLCHLT